MEMFNEMKRRLSFTKIIMKIILITLILYYIILTLPYYEATHAALESVVNFFNFELHSWLNSQVFLKLSLHCSLLTNISCVMLFYKALQILYHYYFLMK